MLQNHREETHWTTPLEHSADPLSSAFQELTSLTSPSDLPRFSLQVKSLAIQLVIQRKELGDQSGLFLLTSHPHNVTKSCLLYLCNNSLLTSSTYPLRLRHFSLGSHVFGSLSILFLVFPALQYVFPLIHLPCFCQKDPSRKK